MQTNMNAESVGELKTLAQELLVAAYAFWEKHQEVCGPNAVVWLDDIDGRFVLFTRSEYREAILRAARLETCDEPPLRLDKS